MNTIQPFDSSINSQRVVQKNAFKSKTYKLEYPKYDFRNMIIRLHKEFGFRKTIEKVLYMRFLWNHENIKYIREYLNRLKDIFSYDYKLFQGFITIELILDLEERAKLVQGCSKDYGGIDIANTYSYSKSKRIYDNYCYEKLFKEYELELPDALESQRDWIIFNRGQLEQSGIFEDLIQKAFDQLKIEINIYEKIKELREDKLDDYEKRLLLVHLKHDEYLQKNPNFNEIIEALELEIGLKDYVF